VVDVKKHFDEKLEFRVNVEAAVFYLHPFLCISNKSNVPLSLLMTHSRKQYPEKGKRALDQRAGDIL